MRFESIMAESALENPLSIEAFIVFPTASSSRILSYINTLESTAIAIVKIIPAIPGNVSVALKPANIPNIKSTVKIRETAAIDPDLL